MESHAGCGIATLMREANDSYTILPERKRLVAAGWNPELQPVEFPGLGHRVKGKP